MVGSIISGALSAGASVYDTYSNNKNVEKQLEAQAKENQKTREYNLMLAKKQNDWNREQWNLENAYNTPAAQKARLEAAGLNADLMYGGSGVSNTAASSPQMTSGAAASPMDWSSLSNMKTYGSIVDNYLDAQLKQAQINKLNSEAEGQDITNDILASDSKFRDAWNQGQLDTAYSNISLNNVKGELSRQQIKESQARITQIDATVQKFGVEMESIRNAMANDNARLELEKVFNEANIKRLAAASDLDLSSANKISRELEKILRQYDDNHDIAEQQKIILGRDAFIRLQQGKEAEFNARINTYEGYTSDMNFFQNCNKFLLQMVNLVSDVIPFAGD